ncbi:hypothetical protein MJM95_30615, partial [Salmonella enterica subsp. enterica serovar Anatum]|nr:hypothetical protein [Salmonella enterica subsp. enterica serovar Anatum]
VNSQVKQAQYNFVGASEQLESAHRSVVQTVRSSFNNINASISKIANLEVQLAEAQTRERDTVLRIKAEMENLRRRTEQDIEKAH